MRGRSNNHKIVTISQMFIFKWGFCRCCRRPCLSSLILHGKSLVKKSFFRILSSQKNAYFTKNPDFYLIRFIGSNCGFMIRFWICPKIAKSIFGFRNSDWFPPHPPPPKKTHIINSWLVTCRQEPMSSCYRISCSKNNKIFWCIGPVCFSEAIFVSRTMKSYWN